MNVESKQRLCERDKECSHSGFLLSSIHISSKVTIFAVKIRHLFLHFEIDRIDEIIDKAMIGLS